MKSRTTLSFRRCFANLPPDVQGQAREAYRKFSENPHHPSLRFKKVHTIDPVYSVRVSRNCRALAVQSEEEIVWFWIGSHDEYQRILSSH